IRRREAEVVQLEHPWPGTLGQPQGVDARQQVPAVDPHLNQPRHRRLLSIRPRGGRRHRRYRSPHSAPRDLRPDRSVRPLGARRRELREIVPPPLVYARSLNLFYQNTKKDLGCNSNESCLAFCDKPENKDKCDQYAKKEQL